MNIEFVGKFYDNHSLTIINRQLALLLEKEKNITLSLTPLDEYNPASKLNKDIIKKLKALEAVEFTESVDLQIRHSYPPVWHWPKDDSTKVVFIQPWEFPKVPFEWQYKWETFADHLIVPSNYIKNIVTQGGMNPNDITVVPNGFDETIFNKKGSKLTKYGINPDKFNFLYVGNSQWRKGLDILINEWHGAFKAFDNAKLIIKDNPAIYGQNNVLNEIIKMQYKTGCGTVIYIDDELSDEDMSALYRSSKVVVHPYRAEGFGMHIQEAVACGCLPILPTSGPHEDFIPPDVGIRVETQQAAVDITSNQVFAQKPGDSFTLMNTHTFINEPVGQNLKKALQWIYHSHDKKEVFAKLEGVEMTNTWTNVAKQYMEVINNVNKSDARPKRFR